VKVIGFIVSVAVCAVPVVTAEIVAVAAAAPVCFVDTVNVPVFAPEAIVIEAGTVALAVLLLDSVTVVLAVALAERVTVPVEGNPAFTVVGFKETDATVCAEARQGSNKAKSKNRNRIGALVGPRCFGTV